MLSFNHDDKVTCENCGTETTKINLAGHKKKCSVGTPYCAKCPNFSTRSLADLNFHIAKSIAYPSQRKFTSVNFVTKFLIVFFLRLDKQKMNNAQSVLEMRKVYWRSKLWM